MKNDDIFAPLNTVSRTFDEHPITATVSALRDITRKVNNCARARTKSQDKLEPLRHITMVGALKEDDCLNCTDFLILTDGLRHLMEAGFLIDPDFELDIVNFVYGRDFLEETTPTDIVLGCHLFDSNSHPPFTDPESYRQRFNKAIAAKQNGELPQQGGMVFDEYIGSTILSPLTYDKDAWYERIKKANAKIVVNDRTELEITRFLGNGFSVVSDQHSYTRPSFERSHYQEYQYAFADNFMSKMYPYLNPFSALARDIDQSLRQGLCVIDRVRNRRVERAPLIPGI